MARFLGPSSGYSQRMASSSGHTERSTETAQRASLEDKIGSSKQLNFWAWVQIQPGDWEDFEEEAVFNFVNILETT